MQRITTTETRLGMAKVLDQVDAGQRITITRDGTDAAVLVAPWEAELLADLVERWRERQPPFTDDDVVRPIMEALQRIDVSDLAGMERIDNAPSSSPNL